MEDKNDVIITLTIQDPRRPLASGGNLKEFLEMRVVLTGECAISTAEAIELSEHLLQISRSDRLVALRMKAGAETVADVTVERKPCMPICPHKWVGEDYEAEFKKSFEIDKGPSAVAIQIASPALSELLKSLSGEKP